MYYYNFFSLLAWNGKNVKKMKKKKNFFEKA